MSEFYAEPEEHEDNLLSKNPTFKEEYPTINPLDQKLKMGTQHPSSFHMEI
jgi:hypothetical protein